MLNYFRVKYFIMRRKPVLLASRCSRTTWICCRRIFIRSDTTRSCDLRQCSTATTRRQSTTHDWRVNRAPLLSLMYFAPKAPGRLMRSAGRSSRTKLNCFYSVDSTSRSRERSVGLQSSLICMLFSVHIVHQWQVRRPRVGHGSIFLDPIHKYLVLNRTRKLCATNYSNADS